MYELTAEDVEFLLNLLYFSKNSWKKVLKTVPKSQVSGFKKAISMCESISFKLKEGVDNA